MAGLGSIYAGIGLAQGLGGIPQAYTMGRRAAEESAMAALQRKSQVETLQNQKLTRERAIAEMQDKENLRKRIAELDGLGQKLQKTLEGEEVEVEEPVLKSTSEQMKDSLVGAVPKPSLDLSGKPVNLGGMGSPFGGTPYETRTKTVKQVNFDKLAEIKNQMAMGYQQLALQDPRYSAVGEKAIDEIDKGILTRTFAAGMSGDTDTVSKGLKALTGQEFSVSSVGDYFEIKGVGDSAPMKVKRSEIHLLADPINFAKAAQKYAEMQQKQLFTQMKYDAIKQSSNARHFSSYPFLIITRENQMIPAINEKDAQEIAEAYGVGYVPNKDYEKKVAQINVLKSQANKNNNADKPKSVYRPKSQ